MSRKPIIYLTRTFSGTTPEAILKGLLMASREEKRTVVILKGGVLDSEESFIYDLVEPDKISGLITWASTDSMDRNPYYEKFKNVNKISLSIELPGMKAIVADSYSGMLDGIIHLIEDHNRKKILFIRGPENHGYAQERYQAYLDGLKTQNITFSQTLVTPPGKWSTDWGEDSMVDFIDNRGLKPGKDFDAVVCVNDNVAIGAINILKKKNITVPGDVAVIGYNNTDIGRSYSPSITTVDMPFIPQGYEAIKSIIKMENSETLESLIKLPATLTIAQSCGCLSKHVTGAYSGNTVKQSKKSGVFSKNNGKLTIINPDAQQVVTREEAIDIIVKNILPVLDYSAVHDKNIETLAEKICRSLIFEIENGQKGSLLSVLNNLINYLVDRGFPIEPLHEFFSLIRTYLGVLIPGCHSYIKAEDIISQARVFVAESSLKERDREAMKKYEETIRLQKISSKLMTVFKKNEIMDLLRAELPSLGIKGIYLYLYRKPLDSSENIEDCDFYSVYGGYHGSKGVKELKPGILYPEDFIENNSSLLLTVHGLSFKELRFGHVIYEIGTENGIIYDTMTEQISSTLYAINMYEENNRVKSKLEGIFTQVEGKVEVAADSSANINNGVHEGSTAMEEIAANIKEISRNLKDVMTKIDSSVLQINETSSEVDVLIEETHKIGNIVAIITDIAERTKLLSFNASIEAARAGVAGKGFAIVSKEVKELAYSTIDSAENIKGMIDNVRNGTSLTSKLVTNLRDIIIQIADSSSIIENALQEQTLATGDLSSLFIDAATGTDQISRALEEIREITRENG